MSDNRISLYRNIGFQTRNGNNETIDLKAFIDKVQVFMKNKLNLFPAIWIQNVQNFQHC